MDRHDLGRKMVEAHVETDGGCGERLCWFAYAHEQADQQWCEEHGAWLIGNPCGSPGVGEGDDRG